VCAGVRGKSGNRPFSSTTLIFLLFLVFAGKRHVWANLRELPALIGVLDGNLIQARANINFVVSRNKWQKQVKNKWQKTSGKKQVAKNKSETVLNERTKDSTTRTTRMNARTSDATAWKKRKKDN
jgi:hypothetical protein